MKEALSSLQKMGAASRAGGEDGASATGKDPGAAAANSVDLSTALAAVGTMASGGKDVKPVDFHALKDLLPASVGEPRAQRSVGPERRGGRHERQQRDRALRRRG